MKMYPYQKARAGLKQPSRTYEADLLELSGSWGGPDNEEPQGGLQNKESPFGLPYGNQAKT